MPLIELRLPALSRALLVAGVLAMLGACQSEPEPVRTEQLLTMGTIVEIGLWGVPEAQAQRAFTRARADFEFMHEAWHPWKPGPLGRTNQLLAATAWFSANPSVLPLIDPATELYERSGGLFNPAIGKLVALWGFHQDERPAGPPPSAEAIAALLAAGPGMDDIEREGIRMRSTNAAVQLDMGAFAKGVAVDRVIAGLREMGVENAIVNAGGDLRAIGRPGDRPWRIGVRHPRGEGMLAALELSGDESVFTSGDYERYFDYEGTRYHHILDPRTGYPARGTASVTVIHRDAATADAAATALFVAGPEQWHERARAMGLRYVMLVDAEGTVHLSPAMARRVRFEVEPAPRVILSAPL